MVRVPAFAKLNLDLRVLYKRPDGFHELRSVFQTISRKNVRGLKCLAGVRSLNDRGSGSRTVGGRYGLRLDIYEAPILTGAALE